MQILFQSLEASGGREHFMNESHRKEVYKVVQIDYECCAAMS